MWLGIKKVYFEKKKLNDRPKELWKALTFLGLPNRTSSCEVRTLKTKKQFNLILTQF